MVNIICLYNNNEIYRKVIEQNENLAGCNIFSYNNLQNGFSIPKFYNKFINENILSSDNDSWNIFIHQDFGFLENIENFCKNRDKNSIYGAIGVRFFVLASKDKKPIQKKFPVGKILQGDNDFNFQEYGFDIEEESFVNSIDCCCIMIHSSIIREHKLLFDENLSFHMYAEELCYRAKNDYKIGIKVAPLKCFHLGTGNLDEEFEKSLRYLQKKFNTDLIPSTCPTELMI